jgi:hypothetical protein
MKHIVPLFRENPGRSLSWVNWDTFQDGFCVVLLGDKVKSVTWDQWWRERKTSDRRKGMPRRSNEQIELQVGSKGEALRPLRDARERRANRDQQASGDRRRSVSREKLFRFADFICELRTKQVPADESSLRLVRLFAGLTTRESYEAWTKHSRMTPFFKESEWDERENREKFTAYAVASFLDLIQPGSIYWKGSSPNVDNMKLVSRIVTVFVRASANVRSRAIWTFYEGKIGLEGMCRILGGESLGDKKELLQLVWANRELKPKAFCAKLSGPLKDFGFKLSSNPNSYRKQIERLKKDATIYINSLSR